jgi:class 3 adenylate cyclase
MAATTTPIRYARSTDDVHIAYRVVGSGPVDVALLPGFVNHLEVVLEVSEIARFVERLASFSRLVLFDRRGQGLSDRPAMFTMEDHMRDLVAVLDEVGMERAALIGVSEGGPASIMAAAAHPDRISELVLVGTWARIVEADDYPFGAPVRTLERLRQLIVGHWGEPVALPLFFGPEAAAEPRLQEFWARLLRSGTSPAGVNRLIDVWHEFDVRPLLPSVRQRTLVVGRTGDVLAPMPFAQYLADHLPAAKLVELPGPHHPAIGDGSAEVVDEIEEFLTGESHRPETDRVLATVLFSDIVGSTQRAAELGDARWRELLSDHDVAVRRELARFGGREVKHLGDGFFAAFDGPARAIRCAEAITAAVRPGVEVRAGVHTGECEVRGDDLAGMAVHIGARVAALAGPSEVLVSGTVRDLVVGSGLPLEDRGTHELKGVDGEWRLFALQR